MTGVQEQVKYYNPEEYWAMKKNYIPIRLQIGITLRLISTPKRYALGKLDHKKFVTALK